MLASAAVRNVLKAAALLVLMGLLFLAIRPSTDSLSLMTIDADGFGASDYSAAAREKRLSLDTHVEKARQQPDSWLALERAGMARYRAAKFSGDFDGMDRAYRQLAQARALAPDPSGPLYASAILALGMHQLDAAERYLDVIEKRAVRPATAEQAEMIAMRGDIAFYRGRYDEARRLYEGALALEVHPGLYVRLAEWHQRMGDLDSAMRSFELAAEAGGKISPELASTLLLYAGGAQLKRGDWDAARAYFERADELFDGYWLTAAHLAQLDAATGDLVGAEARYRKILSGHDEPSVMTALAGVLEARGEDTEAKALTRRAEAIFADRARDYPEAFADHVLDATLSAQDPAAALKAARTNHAARPYGDAKVGMARALIAAGKPEEARRWLEEVEASGWRSTEQYLAMADACSAIGDKACVREARRDAERFNPKALAEGSDFLAFGNH